MNKFLSLSLSAIFALSAFTANAAIMVTPDVSIDVVANSVADNNAETNTVTNTIDWTISDKMVSDWKDNTQYIGKLTPQWDELRSFEYRRSAYQVYRFDVYRYVNGEETKIATQYQLPNKANYTFTDSVFTKAYAYGVTDPEVFYMVKYSLVDIQNQIEMRVYNNGKVDTQGYSTFNGAHDYRAYVTGQNMDVDGQWMPYQAYNQYNNWVKMWGENPNVGYEVYSLGALLSGDKSYSTALEAGKTALANDKMGETNAILIGNSFGIKAPFYSAVTYVEGSTITVKSESDYCESFTIDGKESVDNEFQNMAAGTYYGTFNIENTFATGTWGFGPAEVESSGPLTPQEPTAPVGKMEADNIVNDEAYNFTYHSTLTYDCDPGNTGYTFEKVTITVNDDNGAVISSFNSDSTSGECDLFFNPEMAWTSTVNVTSYYRDNQGFTHTSSTEIDWDYEDVKSPNPEELDPYASAYLGGNEFQTNVNLKTDAIEKYAGIVKHYVSVINAAGEELTVKDANDDGHLEVIGDETVIKLEVTDESGISFTDGRYDFTVIDKPTLEYVEIGGGIQILPKDSSLGGIESGYYGNLSYFETEGYGSIGSVPLAVETVAGESATVVAQNGEIIVANTDADVAIYTINGQLIYKGFDRNIACNAGAYVVAIDGKAFKVVVR